MISKIVWNLKLAAIYFWMADYPNMMTQLGIRIPARGATIR